MKQKNFIFLLALALMTLMPSVGWGQTYGSEQSEPIEISGGGTHNVTLKGVQLDFEEENRCAFAITNNSTVYLTLQGDNELRSGYNHAGIYVETGSTLIITKESGDAHLKAESASKTHPTQDVFGAGIGGGYNGANPNFGTIIIEGGNIEAYSYTDLDEAHADGAGIGGGKGSSIGNIIIKGGNVRSACIDDYGLTDGSVNKRAVGAGIGGGFEGTVSYVAILGGTVQAWTDGSSWYGDAPEIGGGEKGTAPTIILGRWDQSTPQPVITANPSKGKLCDARTGAINTSVSNQNVTLPAGLQMYLMQSPTAGYLNAYHLDIVPTVINDGQHTVTLYDIDGNGKNGTVDELAGMYDGMYYGAGYQVDLPSNLKCSRKHNFMGWLETTGSEKKIVAPVEGQGSVNVDQSTENKLLLRFETPGSDASNIQEYKYQPVWVDNEQYIYVKSGSNWPGNGTATSPSIDVAPKEAVGLLTYSLDTKSHEELNGVAFSSAKGYENYLTGTPTIKGEGPENEIKTFTDVVATVSVKDSETPSAQVVLNPFTIYKNDVEITSVEITAANEHVYNGKPHNGLTSLSLEEDHILTVTGKIGEDVQTKALREGLYYRIVSYKKDNGNKQSVTDNGNKDNSIELKDAGEYSEITIETLGGTTLAEALGGTDGADGRKQYTIKDKTITIKKADIVVTPTTTEWTIGSEEPFKINFTPAEGTTIESTGEKVHYTEGTALALSGVEGGTPTVKGEYDIIIGTLAIADSKDGFRKSNYNDLKLAEGTFKVKVKEDITNNPSINLNVVAASSSLAYNGQEQDPQITVTGFSGATEGTDYEVTLTPSPVAKKAETYTNAADLRVKDAGSYTVTLTGKGLYTGTKTATFTVAKAQITKATANPQTVTLGKVADEFDKTVSAKTVALEGLQNGETPVFDTEGSALKLADDASNYTEAKEYPGAIQIEKIALADGENFLASNYEISESLEKVAGTLTVKADEDIEINVPEGGDITVDGDNWKMTYDGKAYNDMKVPVSIKGVEKELLQGTDYEVRFAKSDDAEFDSSKPWNVGSYTITVTIKGDDEVLADYNGKSVTKTLTVEARTLKLRAMEQVVVSEEDVTTTPTLGETVEIINGQLDNETPAFEGALSVKEGTYEKGEAYSDAIVTSELTLKDNASFLKENYTLESEDGTLVIQKDAGNLDPTDPKDPEIKPGDGDDDDNDWVWNPETNAFEIEYDGYLHTIKTITVRVEGREEAYVLRETTDFTVKYTPNEPKDVLENGSYTAKITFEEGGIISNTETSTMTLCITPKEYLNVDLLLPNSVREGETPDWGEEDIVVTGYVGEEEAVVEASLSIEDGKVELSGFPFVKDNVETGFKVKNYSVRYFNNGEDITDEIVDGNENGTVTLPDDIISVDDNTGGGIIVNYNDLHITRSTGAKLVSRHGKMRVKDGGSFTISLEKEPGYEDCEPVVYVRRGRYGEWKELKVDEVSGYYQIRSVYTDIYVKVSGDGIWPVSNEQIEAQDVKVYTRGGKIVVVTPQPMDVQVVSMTGALVAIEKVAGQHEFDNLAAGAYIVRAGETIVKIRL